MSQRIFAIVWLLVSAAMGWLALAFNVQFSYEPVGPKAWPLVLAALMALSAIYLFFRPGEEPEWPAPKTLGRIALLALSLLLYAIYFQSLGFPIATALMTIAVGRLFGGSWKAAVLTGIGMGIGLYFFFDRLLDVVLPLGGLIRGFGG
ncbi:tripartite tricarboxylate transporter TctB family protein [Granulosicoccaceae sp. 1_MG-2023]|nr:tripartite tricarboxylate transporter TctB family protein [Granulosicoccaceae sp. 1_MG-2023]